jgi:hypothetical protein
LTFLTADLGYGDADEMPIKVQLRTKIAEILERKGLARTSNESALLFSRSAFTSDLEEMQKRLKRRWHKFVNAFKRESAPRRRTINTPRSPSPVTHPG